MIKFGGNIVFKWLTGVFLLFGGACENREWNNPFDPDCPREIFTPNNFTATQDGDEVILSWNQTNTNITGFKIDRQIENENFSFVASPGRYENTVANQITEVGKLHTYILYAYAGPNKSNELTAIITPFLLPTVKTGQVEVFTSDAAVMSGTVTSNGGLTVTERGICYSEAPNPTINQNKVILGTGIGEFSFKEDNLNKNTKYYIRAYAINSKGISYGNEVNFKTDDSLIDVDGNDYATVIIDDQVWMTENLRTTKYDDGTSIPLITDGTTWSNFSEGAYCYYANDTNNQIVYGNLYNWYTVVDNRKLCPSGWHVPTMTEVNKLRTYLGGEFVAGGKLKEVGTNHWYSPNTGATNESGFNALPSGNRNYFGNFDNSLGRSTAFWTTQDLNSFGGVFILGNGSADMLIRGFGKLTGSPVRCIKD